MDVNMGGYVALLCHEKPDIMSYHYDYVTDVVLLIVFSYRTTRQNNIGNPCRDHE